MRRVALGVAGVVTLMLAMAAAAAPMSVQVRQSPVRSTPSFLGPVVATLNYGDRVEVSSEQGAWMQVRTSAGKAGWVHTSALTKKDVSMSAGGAATGTGASSDELALAGKGFSADVEAQFRAQHQDVDFAWVDRMEKMRVDVDRMAAFLKTGGLSVAEGGAR